MTRDQLIEQYPIAIAERDGKQIQYFSKSSNKWVDCARWGALYGNEILRIKPEPTKRLPTIEEVEQWFLENKVFKGRTAGGMYRISSIEDKTTILIADAYRNINEFCTKFTHLDGTELYITEK